MKHLLNNLSKEEKQSILEKHNGGIKVSSDNFEKLIGYKSGVYVGFHSAVSKSGFICYLTDKNKPKIYRY